MTLFDVMARRWHGAGPEPVHKAQFASAAISPRQAAGLGLLGEVLARLPGVEKPMIQVISGAPSGSAMPVARALAISAAQRFGRTLLISSEDSGSHDMPARGLSWLLSELSVESADTIIPDGSVAGLYHIRHRDDLQGSAQLQGWFGEPHGISFIVVSSRAIAVEPRTIALASGCHGSILAVEAGRSRAEDVATQTQQLACAGVRVLGSVLYNAPRPYIGILRTHHST